MEDTMPIPDSDGKYWVCILGPIDFPANNTSMDVAPRRAAMGAIKEVVHKEDDSETTPDLDFNGWSEWGVTKKKVDSVLVALHADDESIDGCAQLSKLKKENERLERILGTIMMKVDEIEIFNMDIREFNRVGGYVEETRDGSFYRYKWISSSEQL